MNKQDISSFDLYLSIFFRNTLSTLLYERSHCSASAPREIDEKEDQGTRKMPGHGLTI
jgi:hypothetical protein